MWKKTTFDLLALKVKVWVIRFGPGLIISLKILEPAQSNLKEGRPNPTLKPERFKTGLEFCKVFKKNFRNRTFVLVQPK